MISVNADHFLASSDFISHFEDTGIEVLWLHCAACE